MDMIILDGKQIQEVTPEGFWYVDSSGKREYIDFTACYANYVRRVTSPEYIEKAKELNPQDRWDEEGIKGYIARCVDWKEIGRCQGLGPPWDDDGPYVQFHTEPPIRFKFDSDEGQDKIARVMRAAWGPEFLEPVWRFFDLS